MTISTNKVKLVVDKNSFETENKVRIYKTTAPLVLTYADGTRAETARTKQLLKSSVMRTFKRSQAHIERRILRKGAKTGRCKV